MRVWSTLHPCITRTAGCFPSEAGRKIVPASFLPSAVNAMLSPGMAYTLSRLSLVARKGVRPSFDDRCLRYLYENGLRLMLLQILRAHVSHGDLQSTDQGIDDALEAPGVLDEAGDALSYHALPARKVAIARTLLLEHVHRAH